MEIKAPEIYVLSRTAIRVLGSTYLKVTGIVTKEKVLPSPRSI